MCGKFIAESDAWIHYSRTLSDYELMVVTKGTLYIANQSKRFIVHEGEYLLMPPSKSQFGYKQSRCTFYWLHFNINETKNESINLSIPEQAKLRDLERLIVLLKQQQDQDIRYKNRKYNSFMTAAILCEIEQQNAISVNNEKIFSQEHLIEETKEYIRWHIQENLKVSTIANYFSYNEKYLTTLFKTVTGLSIKQYILQLKMERAKIALSDTNQHVSQIAYSLGYEDSHYFSNAFKKLMGLSPSEYKLKYGKETINREK